MADVNLSKKLGTKLNVDFCVESTGQFQFVARRGGRYWRWAFCHAVFSRLGLLSTLQQKLVMGPMRKWHPVKITVHVHADMG